MVQSVAVATRSICWWSDGAQWESVVEPAILVPLPYFDVMARENKVGPAIRVEGVFQVMVNGYGNEPVIKECHEHSLTGCVNAVLAGYDVALIIPVF